MQTLCNSFSHQLAEGAVNSAIEMAVISSDVSLSKGATEAQVGAIATTFTASVKRGLADLDLEMKGGRALVRVEGRGMVPWDNIVRGGFLNRARVVEIAEGGE